MKKHMTIFVSFRNCDPEQSSEERGCLFTVNMDAETVISIICSFHNITKIVLRDDC